jgi:hypothetical protein
MLTAKFIALYTDTTVTTKTAPLFGLLWFIFSDFIPRVIPTLSFVLLMQTRRRSRQSQLNSLDYKQRCFSDDVHSDDFQFIRIASGERYEEEIAKLDKDAYIIDNPYEYDAEFELDFDHESIDDTLDDLFTIRFDSKSNDHLPSPFSPVKPSHQTENMNMNHMIYNPTVESNKNGKSHIIV